MRPDGSIGSNVCRDAIGPCAPARSRRRLDSVMLKVFEPAPAPASTGGHSVVLDAFAAPRERPEAAKRKTASRAALRARAAAVQEAQLRAAVAGRASLVAAASAPAMSAVDRLQAVRARVLASSGAGGQALPP